METSKAVRILLVDDREENLASLNAVLRSPEYHLVNATSGPQALEILSEGDFAVILMDVQMPGMDGLETARRLRKMERSANTPVILVTGLFPDEIHIRLGYEVGAVDFVSKPFDPRILKSKVAVFVELFRKTEKIREQEKLLHEAAESRFRTLFEQSSFGIRLYSPDGDCVEANSAWGKLVGDKADELTSINAIREPGKLPAGTGIVKALSGESSDLPPIRFMDKWIKAFAYPIRNEQGAIREAAVIFQDVSETMLVEEELRRSRDQLRIIFERVADGVVVHDRELRVVYANDIGATRLGFESADKLMAGGYLFDLPRAKFEITGQDGKPVDFDRLPTKLALRGEHPSPEMTSKFKDRETGKETWLEVSSRPVLDGAGRPYLAVTIFRDITEQKRSADRDRFLARSTEILASSLDYKATLKGIGELAVGWIADWFKISLVDEEGRLQIAALSNVDPRLTPIAGRTIGDEYMTKPDGQKSSDYVISTGRSVLLSDISEVDIRSVSADQSAYERFAALGMTSLIIAPIRVRDGILGTVALAYASSGRNYDAADLKLVEELGRRIGMTIENAMLYHEAQAHRERLQKAVQAREEFISIASHELKTPVTSLILHAEMAALQLQGRQTAEEIRERVQKYLIISTSQIDRLSRLIDEMLDVSRIANGKLSMQMERVDLARLAQGVVEDFSDQITKAGSKLEFSAEGELFVQCDRYRIEQVVTNLVTNAMKYGEGKPIYVTVDRQGDKVVLIVKDEGLGIALDDQLRIFERFERAVSASAVSGLGLGLYIVKEIVEGHGGKVSVRSQPGHGAEFIVALDAV